MVLLTLNIIIAFRVFEMTNFKGLVSILENIYVVILALFLGTRLVRRVITKNFKLTQLDFLFILFLFLPVLSSISSYYEFNQPIFFGLATMRAFYLFIGAWMIFSWLKEGKITLKQLEYSLIFVAWFTTITSYLSDLIVLQLLQYSLFFFFITS